jgi:hypothetical protein
MLRSSRKHLQEVSHEQGRDYSASRRRGQPQGFHQRRIRAGVIPRPATLSSRRRTSSTALLGGKSCGTSTIAYLRSETDSRENDSPAAQYRPTHERFTQLKPPRRRSRLRQDELCPLDTSLLMGGTHTRETDLLI